MTATAALPRPPRALVAVAAAEVVSTAGSLAAASSVGDGSGAATRTFQIDSSAADAAAALLALAPRAARDVGASAAVLSLAATGASPRCTAPMSTVIGADTSAAAAADDDDEDDDDACVLMADVDATTPLTVALRALALTADAATAAARMLATLSAAFSSSSTACAR